MNFQDFLNRTKLDSKPFQTECFEWCLKREQTEPVAPATTRGGILALEMGLGKTIIMLALMNCNLKHHTLIVLPRSLLDQWEKNIKIHLGHQPLVYHGSRPKNMALSLEAITARPIVITTYGQMSYPSAKQGSKGRKLSVLHDIHWNRVICDEGHHVSHKKTNEFKGLQALRTGVCWLVTGTPIQNNEKELYNMYSLFGLPANANYYKGDESYAATAQLFIFHRTKAGVGLRIPALHEHTQKVEWANESERQFAAHIHSLVKFCGIPMEEAAEYIEATEDPCSLRMKYLTKARQVCIYPALMPRAVVQFETILQTLAEDDEADIEIEMAQLYVAESKITAVVKTLLERKGNGCGKIVFCHFYGEIDAMEKRLREQEPTLRIAKFDGRVPNGKREGILSKPVDVLLAQIKMCREGLNLQEHYSEVYFPSPNFNPATEQQAVARCWRIGQQKPVHVFRYEMRDPLGVGDTHLGDTPTPPIDPQMEAEGVEGLAQLEGAPLTLAYSLDTYTTYLHTKKRQNVIRMENASISNASISNASISNANSIQTP